MENLEGDTTQSGGLEMCILLSISELVLVEENARNEVFSILWAGEER